MGTLSFFPTGQAMSRRTAEERVGEMSIFRTLTEDEKRTVRRLVNGAALLGWSVTEGGVIHGFLSSRPRHIIRSVSDLSGRPAVKLFCLNDTVEIFNWRSDRCIMRQPVVLLTRAQQPFFRPCKRCVKAFIRERGVRVAK